MIRSSMVVWRREPGLRVRPARKSNMRRLSYEWLAGLREIVIDPVRCPLAYEEFRLKEVERDRDGTCVDEIPDGNDHPIDAVRYAVMDDVPRGVGVSRRREVLLAATSPLVSRKRRGPHMGLNYCAG